ncbi:MAG: hypothetical protein KKI09_14100 [Spirochaetes bacterium]|nr:hypothetical protein [Spirochaetota bacterium]MBU0956559.1 hypothetical protein [Spirochaetota bacterium]
MIYLERKDRRQFLLDMSQSDEAYSAASNPIQLKLLMESSWWGDYPHPVAVDAALALQQLLQSAEPNAEAVNQALSSARISFMGTDGMRGQVCSVTQADKMASLRKYLRQQSLSPLLLQLACQAFCTMIGEATFGTADLDGTARRIIIGNDGRDQANKWQLLQAVLDGCSLAGFSAEDNGIIPTPYVPWLMLRSGCSCGAMLTASHNPSAQNGIKFFYKAKKLLPEGLIGDFSLSAWMIALALETDPAERPALVQTGTENQISDSAVRTKLATSIAQLAELTIASLPADLARVLAGERFVVDSANGAFHWLAAAVMDRLNLDWYSVDLEPDGSNINLHCGAAELEGRRVLELPEPQNDETLSALPGIVRGLLDTAKTAQARRSWGMALDGDGDRGFLLTYQNAEKQIHILDGDTLGFILAAGMQKETKKQNALVTLSVESDLMCARNMEDVLGLKTVILGVGDKWIAHADSESLLLGLESSGHLVLPIDVEDRFGEKQRLLTGNGFRSLLLAVYELVRSKAGIKYITMPYQRGFSQTRYVYFIDKQLFQAGSSLWKDSIQWMAAQTLPAGLCAKLETKDDSGLLYWSLHREGKQVAAVFARNSGTEDKHAVYLQCLPELSQSLSALAETLWLRHREYLKQENRLENQIGNCLLSYLEKVGRIKIEQARAAVILSQRTKVSNSDFESIIHGLRKEGLVLGSRDAWLQLSPIAATISKKGKLQ